MQKWRKRFEYIIALCLIVVVIGQLLKSLKTSSFSNVSYIISIIEKYLNDFYVWFKQLSFVGRTDLILILIFITIFLFCIRKKRVETFLIVMGFIVITSPLYIQPLQSFYVKFSKQIFVFLSSAIFITLIVLVLRRKTKKVISFTCFVLEMALAGLILYNVFTEKSYVVWEKIRLIWQVVKDSYEYIKPILDPIIILYLLLVFVLMYTSIIRGIIYNVKRKQHTITNVKYKYLDGISICIPAYREVNVITDTINAALEASYPEDKKEIIVVCDGSDDGTFQKINETYKLQPLFEPKPTYRLKRTARFQAMFTSTLYPQLKVIVKENGGKHDALNMGLMYSSDDYHYILNLDADTKLSPDALLLMAQEIIESNASAVAGYIKPIYEPKKEKGFFNTLKTLYPKILVALQQIDYAAAFHITRGGHSLINSQMIISGAFGLFNKEILRSVYGYEKGLGEDMFITLKIQDYNRKHHKKISYVPEAIAYTAAPPKLQQLETQRRRWFKGLLECLLQFKHFIFSKFWYAYLEYFIIEVSTSLFLPFGILIILINPDMLNQTIFQIFMFFTMITAINLSIVALIVERKYRKTNWWLFLCVPLQIIFFALSFIWKTDGILEYKNKSWGSFDKKYNN